ncbi:Pyridoxine/pyridoxamine 5'-phosphate oxidase [Legionella massiliensis]|uniref:Pyridoxine/pyridoxamine 5'-phosphate oxidase n=1 Tax=Legionella massiliensis TaxID=1034943 RepID=A0A078L2W3_9GAMM|nr:pyridoxamine 5'-phosphate oxidase family protein [Legionella massiliensis]CDZ78434.1 Pyridoxine/pyridoxamine 5'-phosphate oxidase [Legionella massiliensis]CEE14172.1 Pyridoxine/pyridoxamine 5'-phosphate oxidase [Legionella massiliensis]
MPFKLLNQWIAEEKDAGAPNPQHAVLATASLKAVPNSRVIAIREISAHDLVFFTQKGTRKVSELTDNPQASLTFWFELLQREVMLEGQVKLLSEVETSDYWLSYPHSAQLRFAAYAPTSMQVISSKQILEDKKIAIETEYMNKKLPLNPYYCGFRFLPKRFVFYAFRLDELSDVNEYYLNDYQWNMRVLSP